MKNIPKPETIIKHRKRIKELESKKGQLQAKLCKVWYNPKNYPKKIELKTTYGELLNKLATSKSLVKEAEIRSFYG